MAELLCFGGPLNEQVVDSSDPDRLVAPLWGVDAWIHEGRRIECRPREVVYSKERIYMPGVLSECWVADGYPVHRITDTIDGIAVICSLVRGV